MLRLTLDTASALCGTQESRRSHGGVTVESRWSQGEGAVSVGGVAVDIFNNSHCTLPSLSLIPNNIHNPHHPYSPFPFQLTIPIPAHFPATPLPTLLYNPHHSHSNSNSQFPFQSPLLIKFPTTRLTPLHVTIVNTPALATFRPLPINGTTGKYHLYDRSGRSF